MKREEPRKPGIDVAALVADLPDSKVEPEKIPSEYDVVA